MQGTDELEKSTYDGQVSSIGFVNAVTLGTYLILEELG